ncbi:nicotinamide N-methyltransferase-like [Dermacentor albipictus]|uniref:nicotinamide N-methyltransferase-like n=1 Tax=Dermacentor albipictus TaxID=60249 RepID=UPI0031FC3976
MATPPPLTHPHESEPKLVKTPDALISNGASKEGLPDYEDSQHSAHAQGYDSLEEYESYFSKIVISNSEETRASASEDNKAGDEDVERLVPIDRLRELLDPGVLTGSVYPSHVRELRLLSEEAHRWLSRRTIGGPLGLDLGCGPMVQFPLLLADGHVDSLVVAHFLDQTRSLLQTWLRDDRDNALNLNGMLGATAQLVGKTPAQLKEQLRCRVSDVVSCDLFNREQGKFLPEKHDREGAYDVVVTSMLLEAVIQDLDTYARVIKRVHGLLRRQGHVMMSGVLGMTYWDMKAGKFNCVTLTKENVEKVLRDAGFMDLEWIIVDREYFHSVSDYTKSFLVLARKP